MQDRSPRIRRIGLAIKSEDFSRRTAPGSDKIGKMIGGDSPDLSTLLPIASSDSSTMVRLTEAGPTELR
ncbi:MAG TPA: hypothetical protein VGQ44_15065 [Gemmatimonadaceae bacterium]|jgi:hypothetical protein|nr:hypothetical protein [Gemmatimonadaceae bacterium]